ncbi:MAG TPA: MFS transporter [Gaiellaceae bacterium]
MGVGPGGPSSPRYRWVVLSGGLTAQTSFSILAIGLPVLAPALHDRYDLSVGGVGVVLAAVGVGMLATLLAWGLLADRIGERAVIAVGLAGAGIAVAAAGTTDTVTALIGLLVLAGAAGASVNAASGRAVMHWFDVRERGLALGIRQTAIPLGGGLAAIALPPIDAAWGLGGAFLAMGSVCVGAALFAWGVMRDAPHAPEEGFVLERGPLADRRLWLLAVGSALLIGAQLAVASFLVFFLHEVRGLSPAEAGAVFALTQVLGAVLRIGAGRWSDRIGERLRPLRLIAVALSLALGVATTLLAAPLPLLLPAFVAAGALGFGWNALSFTAAAEISGAARSGAALGFQQTVLGVATIVTPVVFGVLGEESWYLTFGLAAACPLAALAVLRPLGPGPTGPAHVAGTRGRR